MVGSVLSRVRSPQRAPWAAYALMLCYLLADCRGRSGVASRRTVPVAHADRPAGSARLTRTKGAAVEIQQEGHAVLYVKRQIVDLHSVSAANELNYRPN
jgi:hypothetical protein